jgi:molybdopterin converting factor small subunit
MDPFAGLNGTAKPITWSISGLDPAPEEEWQRMRAFLALREVEMEAMLATVEALFKRGHELVVGTYDYLLQNPDTAAILGWEGGADAQHLAERRRFFTVWLARLLGMDFSADLAHYLFRAGKLHAAHGPRHAHVPPVYVTGSISLVNAAFARFLGEEMPGHPATAQALAGWNKVLALHLHLMQMGYHAAQAVDSGAFRVRFELFGRMRTVTGTHALAVHLPDGGDVQSALRKFFNYYPQARREVFDVEWRGAERIDARGTPWFTATPAYAVRPMWRVLLNGKDVSYIGGPDVRVREGDEIHIFPPGR